MTDNKEKNTADAMKKIDVYGTCPVCKLNWDDGKMVDTFLEQKERGHWKRYTKEQIISSVNFYHNFNNEPTQWTKVILGKDCAICPECECEFPLYEEK